MLPVITHTTQRDTDMTVEHTTIARVYHAMLCYSAVYMLWLCVCLSVRPSQVGVISKRLNVPSCKQRNDSPQTAVFLAPDLGETSMGSPPATRASDADG